MRRLPSGVWVLGFASLFMDASSELVHSVLPIFMATTLGASMATIGLLEGAAEATASIAKVYSGALSDRVRRRKPLVVLGYALATATKPIFALAPTIGWVFGARFLDRIGKGIRGAPRDALVADLVPSEQRGAAFGLRQALDSVGALIGPLAAMGLLALYANDLRAVMWYAVAPALVTVALLVRCVREPDRDPTCELGARGAPVRLVDVRRLPRAFWSVVAIAAVFTLARFSEAFLVLRGENVGLRLELVPLVMVVMNALYAACSYPAGLLADRVGRRGLLVAGLVLLVAADVALATADSVAMLLVGAALWGMHMAATGGLFGKLVVDSAPPDLRGTAFGVFHLAGGLALLVASALAGVLWSNFGPSAPFLAGAGLAGAAALAVALRPAS